LPIALARRAAANRLRRRVVDSAPFSKPLIFIYLLPTLVIAMHYGSTLAVLTSFASGLIAAYFFIIITKLEYLILNHLFRVRSNSRIAEARSTMV
jgi:K+-sensing histidine kinase KdpD